MGQGLARAVLLGLALACASPPDPGLVALRDAVPGLPQRMVYAGPHNFTGAPVPGYEDPECLLTRPAAAALARADDALRRQGYALVVYDCYRPARAVQRFVEWTHEASDPATRAAHHPRVPKDELVERGYIASRSSHSRGSTVDVGLLRVAGTDEPIELDLGTPFDYFDPRAAFDSDEVDAGARAHRERLRRAMVEAGFEPYAPEWWHFTLADEPWPDRRFDVPVRAGGAAP